MFTQNTKSSHLRLVPTAMLVPPDLISVVTFGDTAILELPLTGIHEHRVIRALDNITDAKLRGQTNITDALILGAQQLAHVKANVFKRILLIGDGEANVRADVLTATVALMPKARIRLDCISAGSKTATAALGKLAAMTVKGICQEAHSATALANLILAQVPAKAMHRVQGATVLCIDCSSSMLEEMKDGVCRIDACRLAAHAFVAKHRHLFGHQVGSV